MIYKLNVINAVYVFTDEDRINVVFRKFIPKKGDLCLCLRKHVHSLYNNEYITIRHRGHGKYKIVGNFSALFLRKKVKGITRKQIRLLMTGARVSLQWRV
jgi:hypothetical protein